MKVFLKHIGLFKQTVFETGIILNSYFIHWKTNSHVVWLYQAPFPSISGNSGLRPVTWQGKLFYSFIIPFGFAIYVYIIISFAYHFRDFIVFCIMSLENKKTSEIRFLSTKILMTSLASCLCVAQIGGIISAIDGSGYLNGMYIAIDTMTFTGNESLVKGKAKLAFLFLLSFYFMSLHSLILVFVCDLQQTWNEITSKWNDSKPDCFYQESHSSPEHNYKYKLLASFDSPTSLTPVSDEEADDVCFPQMWSLQYEFEPALPNEPLMVGQTERKSSRFSEIFNAQKELFEPIIELAENQEEEDFSDCSSYKSSYDFFLPAESEPQLQHCLNDLDQFQIADNMGKDEKLSGGESASIDTNKNVLPRLSYTEDTHRDM